VREVITEYYRSRHLFGIPQDTGSSSNDNSALMGIGAIWKQLKGFMKGKGKNDSQKGNKGGNGNSKGKGEHSKGKGKGSKGKGPGNSKGNQVTQPTGKGKSKGKGKNSGNSNNCNVCGKPGHWASQCWYRTTTGAVDDSQHPADDHTHPAADSAGTSMGGLHWDWENLVGRVTQLIAHYNSGDQVMVDSGAATHVCPKDYASESPLLPLALNTPTLHTVTGSPMKLYGQKLVHYKLGPLTASVNYLVSDVHFPVLSVSQLMKLGFVVHLSDSGSFIGKGDHSFPLKRIGQLIFLLPSGRITRPPPGLVAPVGISPLQSGQADHWRLDGDAPVRVHKRPRLVLHSGTGQGNSTTDGLHHARGHPRDGDPLQWPHHSRHRQLERT